jgi:hypothetical protein
MKYCMKTAYLQNLYEIKIYVSFEINLILNNNIPGYAIMLSFHFTLRDKVLILQVQLMRPCK